MSLIPHEIGCLRKIGVYHNLEFIFAVLAFIYIDHDNIVLTDIWENGSIATAKSNRAANSQTIRRVVNKPTVAHENFVHNCTL